MSAHTPGPWFVCSDPDYDNKYTHVGVRPDSHTGYPYKPENGAICVLDDGEYIENQNKKADAHLIAAAPEMLEALKEIIKALRTTGFRNDAIGTAEAAIKKAEGQ